MNESKRPMGFLADDEADPATVIAIDSFEKAPTFGGDPDAEAFKLVASSGGQPIGTPDPIRFPVVLTFTNSVAAALVHLNEPTGEQLSARIDSLAIECARP